jgi:glycosyltransferase involved in cell wall biosynthesis
MRRALGEHLARFDPDVLQIEYTHMAPYARLAPDRVRCLTEHDVAFVSAYRHARAERGVAAAFAYEKYLRTFHYELGALRDFDVVFAVTEREAELLRRYVDGDVYVTGRAPTGVDVDAMGRVERGPDADAMLFVGNFAHRPNVDAMEWFAERILPEIHRLDPSARLVVAGPHAPAQVKKLAADPRVEVLGFVPDLTSLYARAAVVVSPVRVGAGVRVKLLEAFAARVPVVSTAAGAEGIDLVDGGQFLLADDPATFAAATVRILRDRALGDRLAASARCLVEERYAFTSIAAALEDEYRSAIARRQRR